MCRRGSQDGPRSRGFNSACAEALFDCWVVAFVQHLLCTKVGFFAVTALARRRGSCGVREKWAHLRGPTNLGVEDWKRRPRVLLCRLALRFVQSGCVAAFVCCEVNALCGEVLVAVMFPIVAGLVVKSRGLLSSGRGLIDWALTSSD